jgi:hypothetical protein
MCGGLGGCWGDEVTDCDIIKNGHPVTNCDRIGEFRLTEEEWRRSQIVTSSKEGDWSQNVTSSQENTQGVYNHIDVNSSQIVMSSDYENRSKAGKRKHRGTTYLPYAFTEHGVSMLASVLRSEKAVQMSIAIVRAFIALKQYAIKTEGMEQRIRLIIERLEEHDVQLNGIYGAIEKLLEKKAAQEEEEMKWKEREMIGFK